MWPIFASLTAICLLSGSSSAAERRQVSDLRIRILSTMLTNSAGIGEWGFSALVIADGHPILFDTGARPDTVWNNVRELHVDLSSITDVVLSHNHDDHTGGLLTLRRELSKANPKALIHAHVGQGIFLSRPGENGAETNHVRNIRSSYESLGGEFIVYESAKELFPGVWLTGPIKRVHPEKNWSVRFPLLRPDGGRGEDNVPEDMSLVFDTDRGLVVLSGCGHAGIINTLEQARRDIHNAPIYAAIGGFHLFAASDDTLSWTASKLKELGTQNFLGAHCTGIEAVYRIRQITGLTRAHCAVGSVGGGFTLKEGLQPGILSR
jgi:7,8-dihydropterin-6-yl-methyl-4-(beta-D-ribofuranosyl)aminobenzene 5'-phosphate synthase